MVTTSCCVALLSYADSPVILEVGSFSAAAPGHALPSGWKPLTFKKVPRHTSYELVRDDTGIVVKARSESSASGLIKEIKINPTEYPIVRWRWKAENLLQKSDVRRKEGDDYPARLYITFEYDPDKVAFTKKLKYKAGQVIFGAIPIGALNYIWDGTSPAGTIVDNAFTDFAKMIVVRSGPADLGRWVQEERNVYEDYKKAFEEEPPMINGVAIMTDTDNTKEAATAYYGDIQFLNVPHSR
jgi:ABC-type molybdate transport system substrate-binding protein